MFDINQGKVQIVKEDDDMARKIEKDSLIELCREYGCNKKAYEKISEVLGVTSGTVEVYVSRWGIKKMLDSEEVEPVTVSESQDSTEQMDNGMPLAEEQEEEESSVTQKQPKKFYIAGKFCSGGNYLSKIMQLSSILEKIGWEDAFDIKAANEQKVELADIARSKIQSIKNADVVIVLLPDGRETYIELGVANVTAHKILVWAEKEECVNHLSCFLWTDNVTRISGDMLDLLDACLKLEGEIA